MRNITRAQEPFAVGNRVTCNGNPEGIITAIVNYSGSIMYEVRLWSGSRVVGNVCVSEHDITRNNDLAFNSI